MNNQPLSGRHPIRVAGLLVVMLLAVSGCPEPRPPITTDPDFQPLTPLPVEEAVSQINNQMKLIEGGLQAEGGFAKGYFTDADGKRRSFNHDAALLVLPPRYLRFDMKVLGNSVMLLGSNATRYWLATKMDDDALWWGRHNRAGALNIRGVTLQPATMIEAVGVGAIPTDPLPVQRVTLDHQQLIVTGTAADGTTFIEKEYWLSRRPGRNLVRILMRAPDGEVAMDANLSNHELVQERGPSIPRRIEIEWPAAEGQLIFTCRSWKVQPRVDRAFAGFAFPLDRGEKFERIVDIDREYATPTRTRRPGQPNNNTEPRTTQRPPPQDRDQTATDAGHRPVADTDRDPDARYERRPDSRDGTYDRGEPRYGSDTDPRSAPDRSRPPSGQPRPTPRPQPRERQPDSPDDESRPPEKPKDPNVWWEPDQS